MKKIPYSNFSLIPETQIQGFTYGRITDFLDNPDKGCTSGDGFVQAPDGSRAGLIWLVSKKKNIRIYSKPDKETWGTYGVYFEKPVKNLEDLIYNFRKVLPLLIEKYKKSHYYKRIIERNQKKFYKDSLELKGKITFTKEEIH
jgi:hypothetical protein